VLGAEAKRTGQGLTRDARKLRYPGLGGLTGLQRTRNDGGDPGSPPNARQ
jgi:hypothetical protein